MTRRPDDRPVAEISTLARSELAEAAAILARGMRDNPLHVAVFGRDPDRRQKRILQLFCPLIDYVEANGQVLGAYAEARLVGVLGMMEPGACRPTLADRLRFAGIAVAGNPPHRLPRMARWLLAWSRNHPPTSHWHLGPLAVLPAFRRRGIGRLLMTHCCRRMDDLAATAYLETDLAINVAFYETLGFVVIGREDVLGAANWFMSRAPSNGEP